MNTTKTIREMMENLTFEKLPAAVAGLYEKLEHLENLILSQKKEEVVEKKVEQVADEYINRRQAAKILKISLPTLAEWSKRGILKCYRISTRVRFKRKEVEQAVKAIKN